MSGGGDETLALCVEAPAARLGARLRAWLGTQGWALLADGAELPLDGLTLTLTAVDRARTWVVADPPEATPEALAAFASQELRARVTTILVSGEVTACEVHEGGREIGRLVVRGAEVVELDGAAFEGVALDGAAARDALARAGLDPAGIEGRSMALRFAPVRRRAPAEVVEVDPLVTCPRCGAPTQRRASRFGAFYGCVRYPGCRGRRSEADAQEMRARALE